MKKLLIISIFLFSVINCYCQRYGFMDGSLNSVDSTSAWYYFNIDSTFSDSLSEIKIFWKKTNEIAYHYYESKIDSGKKVGNYLRFDPQGRFTVIGYYDGNGKQHGVFEHFLVGNYCL